jgi:hypothetical protein
MKSGNHRKSWKRVRVNTRIHSVEDISVQYEGHTEEIASRPPDVSPHGMFVNTSQRFPEGAVLNLKFRLALSRVEIQTRCEVRYCLPHVGVGVEFVGISPEAVRAIEKEVELCAHPRPRKVPAGKR